MDPVVRDPWHVNFACGDVLNSSGTPSSNFFTFKGPYVGLLVPAGYPCPSRSACLCVWGSLRTNCCLTLLIRFQKLTYEEKMARRLLGADSAATVFNVQEPEENVTQVSATKRHTCTGITRTHGDTPGQKSPVHTGTHMYDYSETHTNASQLLLD